VEISSGNKLNITKRNERSEPTRILIVEDDKLVVAMIEDILAKSNKKCHTSVARNGSSAIDLITNNRFDIAFIDIWLPDTNGIEILAWLKDVNSETVCHIITSQNERSYIDRATKLGVKQYILKPFKEEQILDAIKITY